jgi:hypothetical protein
MTAALSVTHFNALLIATSWDWSRPSRWAIVRLDPVE